MSDQTPDSSTAPPFAPPTAPGPLPPRAPARPAWPLVLGIVLIVLAALGIVIDLSAVVGWRYTGFETPETRQMEAAMLRYRPWLVVTSAVSLVLGAMALAGGIGLVRRRPWSIALVYGWAILRLPVALVGVLLGYRMQEVMFQQMATPPGAPFAPNMAVFQVIGALVGLAWGWGLPIFFVIWLSRRRSRDEIATWRRASQPWG